MHTTDPSTPRRTPTSPRGRHQARRAGGASACVPAWVHALDLPVWVTTADRTLAYVNRKAERLLGIRARDWLGRPCHEAVAGHDEGGAAVCRPGCAVACRAARNEPQPTIDVHVGRDDARRHRTRWTVIPVASDDGGAPVLVHAATDLGRSVECERYLQRLAARSVALREMDPTFRPRPLTPRESEVLDLLAADHEQGEIARELGISKTTVRNHVQRLTAALGAHSLQEAIAMRLLARV